jgi:hypothetical protein
MGKCTSKSNTTKTERSTVLDRSWMKESRNIDRFVYENNINFENNLKLQLLLNQNTKHLDFFQEFEPEEEESLNTFFLHQHKETIQK